MSPFVRESYNEGNLVVVLFMSVGVVVKSRRYGFG